VTIENDAHDVFKNLKHFIRHFISFSFCIALFLVCWKMCCELKVVDVIAGYGSIPIIGPVTFSIKLGDVAVVFLVLMALENLLL